MKLDRRALEGRNTVEEGKNWHMMLEQKGGQEKYRVWGVWWRVGEKREGEKNSFAKCHNKA